MGNGLFLLQLKICANQSNQRSRYLSGLRSKASFGNSNKSLTLQKANAYGDEISDRHTDI